MSHCDCADFWSSGLFGLRHSPSYLLDVASLHEPGVGAVCFVQVLAETSAYKNEVYLLPKQLDVKVTSYTFSTRHGAHRFYSRTRLDILNSSSFRQRLLCSWRICRLMRSLETPDILYFSSFPQRASQITMFGWCGETPQLGHAGHFRTSSHQRDGEFILECQRGHVRLKAPVHRFNKTFFESFPFHPVSSSWSTSNFHDVRWRTEVFHFLVILVHLEIHGVLYAGAMLHVQDGYSQCWKVRVSLRHVRRHSTRYWQHTCHGRFHPRLGTLLTQEQTGYTGANAMAICPSRCCVPSGTRCWHSLFHSDISPLVVYHKCLVAVVVKSKR